MPLYYHTSITVAKMGDFIGITLSDRLQKLQNRAARDIVDRKNIHGQSEIAPNKFGWKYPNVGHIL